MLQKLSRIYPPVIEFLPVFLLFLVFYLVISEYAALPERIPTHFNFQGIPDGTGGKGTLILYPGFGAFLYVLITGVSLAMAVINDPKMLINLPEPAKQKITADQAEFLRIFIVRCLFAIKVITLGLMAYLAYGNLQVASGHADNIGYWPMIFVAALLVTLGFMLIKIFRLIYFRK